MLQDEDIIIQLRILALQLLILRLALLELAFLLGVLLLQLRVLLAHGVEFGLEVAVGVFYYFEALLVINSLLGLLISVILGLLAALGLALLRLTVQGLEVIIYLVRGFHSNILMVNLVILIILVIFFLKI